jgi:murein L,D-transpeptidase YafK
MEMVNRGHRIQQGLRSILFVAAVVAAPLIVHSFADEPGTHAAVPETIMSAEVGTSAKNAAHERPTNAILVDKKTNTLHLAEYIDGAYKIIKTYHATLGQVAGDKEDEGDLKTPEGIYTFKARLTRPTLQKKFGSLAFYMNYPNTFDDLAGHKGSNIMLHATDTPERLKKSYDSLGCVVVNDQEIREIEPHIRLGLTPILIFPELTDEYLKPGQDTGLRNFFYSWIKTWEGKDIDGYIDHYHSDFSAKGKNKEAWKVFKTHLNKIYSSIEIGPESVLFYRHPKYSMITFTQNYRSKLKSGGWGHRSRGTKILYVAEEAGQPKIIAETYTNLMW